MSRRAPASPSSSRCRSVGHSHIPGILSPLFGDVMGTAQEALVGFVLLAPAHGVLW